MVTASFINDYPNITEKSLGWTYGLIVESAATSSMLHIQAAKSNTYHVDNILTLVILPKSRISL